MKRLIETSAKLIRLPLRHLVQTSYEYGCVMFQMIPFKWIPLQISTVINGSIDLIYQKTLSFLS